jgi:hypothetical protein
VSSDHDVLVTAGWHPGWSLSDVLAGYETCDVFARYLVEHGADHGTYHAALFGYLYLNQLRFLDAGPERDALVTPYLAGGEHPVDCLNGVAAGATALSDAALEGMFGAVCAHLERSFQRFNADLGETAPGAIAAQRLRVAFRALHFELHAFELAAALDGVAMPGELELGLERAAQAHGARWPLRDSQLVTLTVAQDGDGFQLVATPHEDAVGTSNAALLGRLAHHRDTCCYLQLDDFVMLYDTRDWDPLLMALLQLCCTRRYGHAHPGVIERIGPLDDDGDYFVVHCPTGQDPAAVRDLVSAMHPNRKIVIHPF